MKTIREEFEANRSQVTVDDNVSRNAKSWRKEIEQFIKDCSEFVVLMSPSANQSHHVDSEISFAETHEKPITPILIKGTKKESIPLALSSYQYEDRRNQFDPENASPEKG
jgi:hypothetical protein